MVQGTRVDGMLFQRIAPDNTISNRSYSTKGPSQAELLLRVTAGIAAELIKAHDANQTVSLNEIRAKISKKFGFGGVPRLVDIISAIPDEYKKALLPKLKARPIRTASGVISNPGLSCFSWLLTMLSPSPFEIDSRGRRDVQTASVSAYRHDGEHMRVCTGLPLRMISSHTLGADTVQVVQTQISITAHRATRATNQPACERSELGTTLTNRLAEEWNN